MATATAFAYNTGATIDGTEQIGSLAVGIPTYGFESTGLEWWGGPDQELGIVVAKPIYAEDQPTPVGETLYLDGTRKGGDIALAGSPSQAAHQLFGYQQSVLGTIGIGSIDKVMFSVLVQLDEPGTQTNSHFIGVGKASMKYQGNPYGGYPGNDNASYGYCSDGSTYGGGGVDVSQLATWGNGDIVDIAIDRSIDAMWVRVNGGDWNNDPSADPNNSSGGLSVSFDAICYPVLCPGYEGTMTIQANPTYGTPNNFKFLGSGETASVAFSRTSNNPETKDQEFIRIAYDLLYGPGDIGGNQQFLTAAAAATALTNAGYWHSYSNFGSSGFKWMTINSINDASASGIGQNNITISITQSGGGMQTETGMYQPTTFPEQYGVPLTGNQIRNTKAGTFTATFSQPVLNPLVALASVGNPSTSVPVQVSAPFTPIWGQATTYQNAQGNGQYTQFTGAEGFNIIRIDGTVTSISFNYTVEEFYSTICFGFVDQNV